MQIGGIEQVEVQIVCHCHNTFLGFFGGGKDNWLEMGLVVGVFHRPNDTASEYHMQDDFENVRAKKCRPSKSTLLRDGHGEKMEAN